MAESQKSTKDGPYAMYVILAGLGAMSVVTVGALVRYSDPTAIVTALGPVTGVIGTLVGAYFGLRGSSLAQQNANSAELARAQTAAPAVSDPGFVPAPAPAVPRAPEPEQDPSAATGALALERLAALDSPSDAGDIDVDLPDPEDVALDTAPADEGDDRDAHGVTA